MSRYRERQFALLGAVLLGLMIGIGVKMYLVFATTPPATLATPTTLYTNTRFGISLRVPTSWRVRLLPFQITWLGPRGVELDLVRDDLLNQAQMHDGCCRRIIMDPQKKHVISDSGPLVPPPTPTTTPLDMHAYAAYELSQLPAFVHAYIVGDRVIGGEKATIEAGVPNNDVPGIIVLIKHRGVVYSIGAPGGLTPSADQNAAISSLQFLDTPAVTPTAHP